MFSQKRQTHLYTHTPHTHTLSLLPFMITAQYSGGQNAFKATVLDVRCIGECDVPLFSVLKHSPLCVFTVSMKTEWRKLHVPSVTVFLFF